MLLVSKYSADPIIGNRKFGLSLDAAAHPSSSRLWDWSTSTMSTLQASLESLLQTVAAVYDHDDLAAALSKYLPCALDSLSQKDSHTLTKAIKQTEKEFRATKKLLSMVDHDGMRRQLEDILAGMKDPQEWSAWTKKETCCLQKISDWIPVLWQLGVEKGRHRDLVRKCLLLCEDVVARMVPHHGNTGERYVAIHCSCIGSAFEAYHCRQTSFPGSQVLCSAQRKPCIRHPRQLSS